VPCKKNIFENLTTYPASLSLGLKHKTTPNQTVTEVLPRPTSCQLLHGIHSHHQQLYILKGKEESWYTNKVSVFFNTL